MSAEFLIAYEVLRPDENGEIPPRVFVYANDGEELDAMVDAGTVSLLIGKTYGYCVFSVVGMCVWSSKPVARLPSRRGVSVKFPNDGDLRAWKRFCRQLHAQLVAGAMPDEAKDAYQRSIRMVYPKWVRVTKRRTTFRSLLATVDEALAKLIH